MCDIKAEDIRNLLDYFSKNTFRAKSSDSKADEALKTCFTLFAQDYHFFVIDNSDGELSSHYPNQLVILEYEKGASPRPASVNREEDEADSLYQNLYDVAKLRDLCYRARFARCRARFPIPVILIDGKFVCRSATLSGGPEIYGRSGYHFFFSSGTPGNEIDENDVEDEIPVPTTSSDWQLFDKVRNQDIRLLKMLSVCYICDLMVEKKKVKFGMNITSSEKVDKERRYADFTILSLPYPGCEFFREYYESGYAAEGLVFDWNQTFVDAHLIVPADNVAIQTEVDWSKYKSWDLVKLTQNYLKLLLTYVSCGSAGVLVHCISGWDRTPLFVSLLRLSLWADGRIHKTLGPAEILYLTLAYDWFLFGHDLADRLNKGEEILFFCFDFLKHITSEDFSVKKRGSIYNSKVDSEVIDGVLLETEIVQSSRGSNTSLNSNCSSISSRSQDCPPQFFTTLSFENSDEIPVTGHHANGNANLISNVPTTWAHSYRQELRSNYSSTTPVAVPSPNTRTRSDSSSSLGCGSWQIISGTGSLRGSTSTADSSSDVSRRSHGSLSSFPEAAEQSDSKSTKNALASSETSKHNHNRYEKLRAVRTIFHNVYNSSGTFRCRGTIPSDTSTGGITGLLDQFVEKVGIRSTRTASN